MGVVAHGVAMGLLTSENLDGQVASSRSCDHYCPLIPFSASVISIYWPFLPATTAIYRVNILGSIYIEYCTGNCRVSKLYSQ